MTRDEFYDIVRNNTPSVIAEDNIMAAFDKHCESQNSGCKILAFESGGVYDASVDYAVNISGRTGKELHNEYSNSGGYHGNGRKWFIKWAIEKGYCREGSDDEIEIVSDL